MKYEKSRAKHFVCQPIFDWEFIHISCIGFRIVFVRAIVHAFPVVGFERGSKTKNLANCSFFYANNSVHCENQKTINAHHQQMITFTKYNKIHTKLCDAKILANKIQIKKMPERKKELELKGTIEMYDKLLFISQIKVYFEMVHCFTG